MKSLVRCTHFLTWNHIAYSTNFTKLVDLVIFCGAGELQVFIENASRNAVYTLRGSDFIKALGTWVKGSILKRNQKASVSVMADECTDIMAVEECQFSVIGRKMALQSNAFWTLCLLRKQMLRAYI